MRGKAAGKRAAWGLADQAFSSLTNFALSAVIARSVSPREFGGFALVFATYLLTLGIARALTTLPLLVRHSAVAEEEWRDGARRATGTALVVGVIAGATCTLAALLFAGARGSLVALAVTLPGLLLQEAWRHSFIARGKPSMALVNDLAWTIVLIPAMLVPVWLGVRSAEVFVLAWGAAGAAGGLVGIAQSRLLPAPHHAWSWLRSHWDISGRQLGEFAALSGSHQLVMYVAGGVVGLVAAGALRAGQVLLGPLNVAYQGIWFITLPELVRILKSRPSSFARTSAAVSIVLAAGGLAYTALILVFGETLGPMLLGKTWPNARDVVLPLALAATSTGAWLGANVGLRALQQPSRSLRIRLVVTTLTLVGGVMGVLVSGAPGAAWGLAITSLLGIPIWWWQFGLGVSEGRELEARAALADDLEVAAEETRA